jgi:hypothetical protein
MLGSCRSCRAVRLGTASQRDLEQLDQPRYQLHIGRFEHRFRRPHRGTLEHGSRHPHGITPPHWPASLDVLQHRPPARLKLVPERSPIALNSPQLFANFRNF